MIRRFFAWNRRVSERFGAPFPHVSAHLYAGYARQVASALMSRQSAVVLEIGAGKSCPYASLLAPRANYHIIGVDVAADAICKNTDLDEAHIADVTRALPFADHSIDAVVSRSVLEHLTDQDAFFAEAARVLKPGGLFIHLLPNKFAPFAVVNQILPNSVTKKLLGFTWEETEGICGFPARYDCCYPRAFERLFKKHGFVNGKIRVSYYQSFYYAFFFPAYIISILYETTVSTLGIRSLCSHLLISAERPVTLQ